MVLYILARAKSETCFPKVSIGSDCFLHIQLEMIDPLINAILVSEGIRPAMLVQPVDYDETTDKDPVTKSILNTIRTHFPELKHSPFYKEFPGILISTKLYDTHSIRMDESIGEILGYPCYKNFANINRDNAITYSIHLNAYMPDGSVHDIFANLCADESKLMQFADIAKQAELAINKPKYNALLGEGKKRIRVVSNPIIPTKVLIEKLLSKEDLTKDDMDAIQNIFFNFDFSKDFQKFFSKTFQQDNSTHVGILLGILLNERNNLLSPFYPLPLHPAEYEEVKLLTLRWEKGVAHILEQTKVEERRKGHHGGRKQHTTRKNMRKGKK